MLKYPVVAVDFDGTLTIKVQYCTVVNYSKQTCSIHQVKFVLIVIIKMQKLKILVFVSGFVLNVEHTMIGILTPQRIFCVKHQKKNKQLNDIYIPWDTREFKLVGECVRHQFLGGGATLNEPRIPCHQALGVSIIKIRPIIIKLGVYLKLIWQIF